MGKRLIRIGEVCNTVGLSRSKVRLMVREGEFPKHIQLTATTVAWDFDQVQAWIQQRLAVSRPAAKVAGATATAAA